MTQFKPLKGELTISRTAGNIHEDQPVCIRLGDAGASSRVVEIRLSLQAFSEALFGTAHTECTFEVGDFDKIGKALEVKREAVFVPSSDSPSRESVAKAAVAPFEVDGWIADIKSALNYHNQQRTTKAPPEDVKAPGTWTTVLFRRWAERSEAASSS